MSHLVMLWRLGNRLRRRTQSYRDNEHSASESEPIAATAHNPRQFGLEFIEGRADKYENTDRNDPDNAAFHQLPSGNVLFQTEVCDEWITTDVTIEVND